jgi:O-acetyl-ADP-ribose deacetylase (regulator of RNase III)
MNNSVPKLLLICLIISTKQVSFAGKSCMSTFGRIIENDAIVMSVSDASFSPSEKMLPRGSALITSSGNLANTGIKAIIHAATGSMTKSGGDYEPTVQSIQNSVANAIQLAQINGFKRIAIPFIGGGIFAARLGVEPSALAEYIVLAAKNSKGSSEIVFVTFGDQDTGYFANAISKFEIQAELVNGSIVDFSHHGASVIVNAANTEVIFGGGLSGVIARSTGYEKEINLEAQDKINSLFRTLANSKP